MWLAMASTFRTFTGTNQQTLSNRYLQLNVCCSLVFVCLYPFLSSFLSRFWISLLCSIAPKSGFLNVLLAP